MKKCMGCMEDYDESLEVCPHCGYEENTKPAEVYHMLPGSILAGKYIIGRTLGYGGFGVTYIGYDAELERKVAIKEYLPGEFSTRIPGQTQVTIYDGERKEQFQAGIEKFMEEAKRLARFQNTAGVVHIYDSFFENDTAYIIMEYIEGETVRAKIDREGKLSLETALAIILPVVSALKEIHKEGILHRDIAPDNIMVDKEGQAKVIDFGASRFATTTHSKSLSVLIKPGYAPVEQYQSRGQQGPWTDVYALASTFYTMLTGITPQDSMERLEKDELKAPSKAGAKVSKNIDTAILNAMNLKVEERTPSMEVLEEELLSKEEVARLVVKKEKKDVGKWPLWAKAATGTVAVAIAAFMILIFTGIIQFQAGSWQPVVVALGNTMVPNVVSVTTEVAELTAADSKLEIQIVGKVYDDEIPEGYVLSQNLQAGSTVEEGTILEVTISAGEETVFMPSVEGLSKEDAIVLLEEQGLQYSIEEVESMVAPGSVVSQSVVAEEKVKKGTEIVLQISIGIADTDANVEVEMPDLKGMDYAEAQSKLAELKLYISKEKEVYDNSVPKGGIVFQSVPAGNMLHEGDSVSVQVSAGKEQSRVPDVQYQSEDTARQMLSDAKMLVSVTYESSAIVSKGLVISQSLEKDALVDVGTSISIVVSTGKETESTPTPSTQATPRPNQQTTTSTSPQTTPTPTPASGSQTTPTATPASGQQATATPTPNREWSGWVETLPAGVSADRYDIETKTQYSRRDKTTITSEDSSLANQGWTLESTSTQKGEWGAWSNWSLNAVESSDIQEVATETRYKYRDKETTSSTEPSMDGWTQNGSKTNYTEWSGWSDNPVSGSSTREVQTQQVEDYNRPITKTQWRYHKYIVSYYNTAQSTQKTTVWRANETAMWAVYNANAGKRELEAHIETSEWMDSPLTYQNDTVGYGDHWFGEETQTVTVGYETKTQYNYRDIWYTYYFYRWTDWIDSGTTQVTGSDTREVQSETYYRYRNRAVTTIYTYSQWSGWSAYSDNPVSGSSTTEVQTKTLYRYKEK